ncbi:hypothetical protein CJO94_12110 [Ralstonia solanacearum]|nr:hypothetical protein CJO94_12110 [Ralstonia solanacearum]
MQSRDLLARMVVGFAALGFFLLFIPSGGRFAYFVTGAIVVAIAISLRLMKIIYPGRFNFVGVRERVLAWYGNLEHHQQFYTNILLFIPVLGYAYLVDRAVLFTPLAQLFFAYCLGVAAYDVIRIYGALSSTLLGKALIAIGFAVGSNLAFGLSGYVIGEMTHVAPSTFPHTLSFLAIGAIPVLFVIVGAIYLPVSILFAPLIWLVSSFERQAPGLVRWLFAKKVEKPARHYVLPTLIFQSVFYAFIVVVTPKVFINVMNGYSSQIESAIGTSIYLFDMHPGTECKNAEGYRVAALGDENYILASKTMLGVKFEKSRKCTLKES